MKELFSGGGSLTDGDLIRALSAMGASPVEVLDATVQVGQLSRGFTAAMASSLGSTLPECSGTVAAHLERRYGINPVSMVFGTAFEDLPETLEALGLTNLPVRWLQEEDWVKGLETLPGLPLDLVGVATWFKGTFSFHGQPDARLFLPGLSADSDLDLRDCDLFGFNEEVTRVRLAGQIRGGVIDAGFSVTQGPTDLRDMIGLHSSHHTHILSDHGTEEELRLPRIAPKQLEFIRGTQ